VVAAVAVGLSQTGTSNEAPKAAQIDPAKAGHILDGGKQAFERRLLSLRGRPVVVNKWASWCGPCRFEFPFFQRVGTRMEGKVAFLGLNSGDHRADAEKFLRQFPVPYDHFEDPNEKIANAVGAPANYPITLFYDASGDQTFVHQGGYAKESRLIADIERYAL
jgi:thiol-disulfide isomerase/thioredoxin